MPETLDKSCTLVQYANDITQLSFHSNNISATQIIQYSFNRILSNIHSKQLTINVDKTQFMVFSASSKKTQRKLEAVTRKLSDQISESINFLDVKINSGLIFEKSISNVLQMMACAIPSIK